MQKKEKDLSIITPESQGPKAAIFSSPSFSWGRIESSPVESLSRLPSIFVIEYGSWFSPLFQLILFGTGKGTTFPYSSEPAIPDYHHIAALSSASAARAGNSQTSKSRHLCFLSVSTQNKKEMTTVAVQRLLKDRKYPFIVTLVFAISIFAAFLLFSNSQSSSLFLSYPGVNVMTQPPPQQKGVLSLDNDSTSVANHVDAGSFNFSWKLCEGPGMVDHIPCLDNRKGVKGLRKLERRERHCPTGPSSYCLVPLPQGYKNPVPWPKSRDMIWYYNVPHPMLVEYKKNQHWVVRSGEYLVFPGGGTQFKDGAGHYIDAIEKILPKIEWGKHTRVVLDVGCGVASFGGYLLDKDVITMSFAPKDEHDAQIQFALERGIPATLSVIATKKLTFPDNVYDVVHCARCRVRWDADGGKPLIEINRILRPGGYFVWSATPVYLKDEEDQNIWKAMVNLTESMCWKTVKKTSIFGSLIAVAIYQKPSMSSCYESREEKNPPVCDSNGHSNISWYEPLDGCLPPLPAVSTKNHHHKWPAPWPQRLETKPVSLFKGGSEETFGADSKHWSALVSDVYLGRLGINWSSIRNVMDMKAGYGGFAAALIDLPLWVMNVVPVNGPDTLSAIFDRGLIGTYHDWCESLSTYPRTYDLLHASFLFEKQTQRCKLVDMVVEMDRILRPGGTLVVQDTMKMMKELIPILKSLQWSTTLHQDEFLVGEKGFWRPRRDSKV